LQRACANADPNPTRPGIWDEVYLKIVWDGVYLKIEGRLVYLWRAVDAEGEILDVLVQAKRNKHDALKLMRKLLKKYSFVPDRLITDDLRSYNAAPRELGIKKRAMSMVGGRIIERRTRISRPDDGNARCRASRAEDQPNDFSQPTPRSTTPSTSNAI
jgi:transposase-like protein